MLSSHCGCVKVCNCEMCGLCCDVLRVLDVGRVCVLFISFNLLFYPVLSRFSTVPIMIIGTYTEQRHNGTLKPHGSAQVSRTKVCFHS